MTKAQTISGILFDKDGTLLDYAKSWVPVNYELARIAAAGDEDLARVLLLAGGMNPDTGYVTPDSLLAAGNTVEIAEGMVAAGSPFTVEALAAHFDGLFANSAQLAVAVTDLAQFFATMHARGYWLGVASSDNEASIRATASWAEFAKRPSKWMVSASTVKGAPAATKPSAISTVLPAASRLSGVT